MLLDVPLTARRIQSVQLRVAEQPQGSSAQFWCGRRKIMLSNIRRAAKVQVSFDRPKKKGRDASTPNP